MRYEEEDTFDSSVVPFTLLFCVLCLRNQSSCVFAADDPLPPPPLHPTSPRPPLPVLLAPVAGLFVGDPGDFRMEAAPREGTSGGNVFDDRVLAGENLPPIYYVILMLVALHGEK